MHINQTHFLRRHIMHPAENSDAECHAMVIQVLDIKVHCTLNKSDDQHHSISKTKTESPPHPNRKGLSPCTAKYPIVCLDTVNHSVIVNTYLVGQG